MPGSPTAFGPRVIPAEAEIRVWRRGIALLKGEGFPRYTLQMISWLKARVRLTLMRLLRLDMADRYVPNPPSAQQTLDIFQGEWMSKLPPPFDGLNAGTVDTFDDQRIAWLLAQFPVQGKRALELGPMEGGHSYMLQKAGASEVVSIEGNTRMYLKCLLIKELLVLDRVRFLAGDIVSYLEASEDRFDLCVASGVLYHMRQPGHMIELAAKTADSLYLWTHYYDEALIARMPGVQPRFRQTETQSALGLEHRVHRYDYGADVAGGAFCGGSALYANWLEKGTLLEILKRAGFSKTIVHQDVPDHPHGPCIALLAHRH